MGKLVSTKVPGLFYRDGKRGRTYFIDKRKGADRIYIRLGIMATYREAVSAYNRECADFDRGKKATGNVRDLRVIDILRKYWVDHLEKLKSGKNSSYHLSALKARLGGIRYIDLTKTDLEDYKTARAQDTSRLTGDHISSRTVQAELSTLNSAVFHCVDIGLLPANTISRFCRVKQGDRDIVVLDDGREGGEHWQAIYAQACRGWETGRPSAYRLNRLLLLTLYETGCRPVEAFRMRHNWWVEIKPGFWLIRIPDTADKIGKQNREVPVSATLYEAARGTLKPGVDDLLFPSTLTYQERGGNGIRKTFRRAVERAGLTAYGYTPYSLRRTRATIWDKIDESACRKAIGHSPRDSHGRSYVMVGYDRLFKLVGKEYNNKFAIARAG